MNFVLHYCVTELSSTLQHSSQTQHSCKAAVKVKDWWPYYGSGG